MAGTAMAIYYAESGNKDAPTIVFIHGGGISGWMWAKQVEYFKDYHCIVPDLPEHGQSLHEGVMSIPDCALRIADLIERTANDKKAHVIGHSLGGKVAVELLSIRPDLINRAVVASALFRPMPFLSLIHKPSVYRFTVWLLKNRTVLDWTVKTFKFPDYYYTENCLKDFQNLTPDSLFQIYDQLYQHLKLPAGLEKISVPTLIIAGQKEPQAMRQSVSDMAGLLPSGRGILLKGADHTYPWTKFPAFNEIINSWITAQTITGDFIDIC